MQRVGVRRGPQGRVCACFLERRRQWRQHPAGLAPATFSSSHPRVQALRPPPCSSWQAGAASCHAQATPVAAAAAPCRAQRRTATHAAGSSSSSSSGGYGPSPTDSDSGYLDVWVSSSQGWLLDSASDLWDTSLTSDITSSAAGGSYDAIMMLGGGLLPGGGLPEWVVRRLEGCLHLYREQAAATARGLRDDAASVPAGAAVAGAAAEQQMDQEQLQRQWRPWAPERSSGACPIVLLGAGTPHKPPVIDEVGAGGMGVGAGRRPWGCNTRCLCSNTRCLCSTAQGSPQPFGQECACVHALHLPALPPAAGRLCAA